MENVAALVSHKFIKLFNKWQFELESYGYKNYAKILNAKNYGVPQNRERIFLVSIRGNEKYHFPLPFNLKYRLKDVLEDNVSERYFLSDKMVKCFVLRNTVAIEKGNEFRFSPTDGNCIAKTITTCAGNRTNDNFIKDYGNKRLSNLINSGKMIDKDICILDAYNQSIHRDASPTITTRVNANTLYVSEPNRKIIFKGEVFDNGEGVYVGTSKAFMRKGLKGISRTLKANTHDAGVVINYRIRKLTPRECFRLMGVSEKNIDKIQNAGLSISQQYKLAGNSIVVNVLYYIFKKMFVEKENENYQLTLF